jgi:micrococcal nuclease
MFHKVFSRKIVLSLILSLLFSILANSSSTTASPRKAKRTINGIVASVGDGDTFRMKDERTILTVRLACIDAPEMKQKPYGAAAANRLRQLLPVGQAVILKVVNIDRYTRTVAEVYSGNRSINLALVQEGYAVIYPQYLKGCPDLQERLISGEASAKSRRLGIWAQNNPVMPWDYRWAN